MFDLPDGVATTTLVGDGASVVVERADYTLSTGRVGLSPHAGRPAATLEVILGEGPSLNVVSVGSDDTRTEAVLSALHTTATFTGGG